LTRGLPRKLYVDNGPAFRSFHLHQIIASLGIALIHARPYQPQGKGKIERFYAQLWIMHSLSKDPAVF
jgi:transposase InsO family protein